LQFSKKTTMIKKEGKNMKILRGKPMRTLALVLSVTLAVTLLAISSGSTLAAPDVGPRGTSYADPANGIYVSPTGNDATANGSINAPYRSINTALAAARSGDTIILRGGTYREGQNVRVRTPNITIKSRAGEWAIIDLTTYNSGHNEDSGGYFDVDSSGGKLQGVEVMGGFYAVCLETKWDWGQADRAGASNIIIEDCKLHDSRSDVVKVKPNCDNVTIRYNEIYRSGRAYNGGNPNGEDNSEGIDNVNGDNMVVQNNYIHDICSNAIYAKGGAINALIENNRIENAYGAGIMVGFDTSPEYFDTGVNPQYYENIGGVVRYNLVIHTGWEGIGLYASKDAQVYNNTLVDVNYAQNYHSALYFGITMQDWEPRAGRPANVNPNIHHNIVSQPATFTRRPMIDIRYANELGGLSALAGNPTMSNNCYYIAGRAAAFADNRPGSTLSNAGLAAWKTHISGDNGSIEVDPALDPVTYLPANPQCAGMGIPGGSQPPLPTPTPTLSLSASPAGSQTAPGNVVLTATLSGAAPNNTGKAIVFTVNGSSYAGTTNASGAATYTVTSPAPGTYSFGASFAGDAGNAPAAAAGISGYTVSSGTTPPASGEADYDIADFYNKSGQLSVRKGEIIAVGQRQYSVVSNSYTISYWSQNTLNAAISWWTDYMNSYAAGGIVEELTGPVTPPTQPPTQPPAQPPAGAGTYNIADFYDKSGQLSVNKGDIIIVGQRQYRVLPNTYTISYWSQNTLNTAISWWTDYMNSYAADGVVVLN
jgi:hypothetical protein